MVNFHLLTGLFKPDTRSLINKIWAPESQAATQKGIPLNKEKRAVFLKRFGKTKKALDLSLERAVSKKLQEKKSLELIPKYSGYQS